MNRQTILKVGQIWIPKPGTSVYEEHPHRRETILDIRGGRVYFKCQDGKHTRLDDMAIQYYTNDMMLGKDTTIVQKKYNVTVIR